MQKYIKIVVFSKADQDVFNILKDIQELKAQVKGLTELVKDITKQLVASVLYTDALKSKGNPPAGGKPDGQYVQAVLAYRARELVVALGTEIATQKYWTSLELVRDINSTTNRSGNVVIAKCLFSGDILIIF